MFIQIKVEHPDLTPIRANPTDAGMDLKTKETTWLKKDTRTLVPTGVRVKIPHNHVGLLFPRSSLSKYGITMTNSVGVIDSDYRGEVLASLMYSGEYDGYVLEKLERIVQLVVVPIALPEVVVSSEPEDQWNATSRGSGGFGSTGRT